MSARVVYAKHALEDLQRLDRSVAKRIIAKIGKFAERENPLQFAKPLKPPFQGRWRFRIGDYRVIVRMSKDGAIYVLFVLRIKHRKEVYE